MFNDTWFCSITTCPYLFLSPFLTSAHHPPLIKITQSWNISNWKGAVRTIRSNFCTLTFVYIRLGETLEGSFGRDLDWTITCGQLQLAPAGVPPQDKPDGCVP